MQNFNWKPILLIGGAAILVYFLFFRNSSSSSTGTGTTGTGGSSSGGNQDQPQTGDITVQPSSENITVGSPAATTTNSQPSPPTSTPGPPVQQGSTPVKYTVKAGDSLASIAKKYGISVASLAHANVYVPGEVSGNKKVGQTLGTGAGLKTGQVLTVPLP